MAGPWTLEENEMKRIGIVVFFVCLLGLTACEDTDIQIAADAGLDVVKAITLSDSEVQSLAAQAARYADEKNKIAPEESQYAMRLRGLVGKHLQTEGSRFDFKVYVAPEINAFAMADGTIRIYSGLMDMMGDEELFFVIGHEMGHVEKNHLRKQMRLAYAGSAVRKVIASQNNAVGELARSELGGFVEQLMNAQFSQQEEKEADDYGLALLTSNGFGPKNAVSALRKLATLGTGHSFLSSHPAPDKRANRLEGKPEKSEERGTDSLLDTVLTYLRSQFPALYDKLSKLFTLAKQETPIR